VSVAVLPETQGIARDPRYCQRPKVLKNDIFYIILSIYAEMVYESNVPVIQRIPVITPEEYDYDLGEYMTNKISDHFMTNNRKMWAAFPIDMGCRLIAKHNGFILNEHRQSIYLFFMHSDAWSQYGDDTDVKKMAEFIPHDYVCGEDDAELETYINQHRLPPRPLLSMPLLSMPLRLEKNIKCPTCRTVSVWSRNDVVVRFRVSSDDSIPKCIVCQDEPVGVILKECGHCTLCKDCALRL